MSEFIDFKTGHPISSDDLLTTPVLVHCDVAGTVVSYAFNDEVVLQRWASSTSGAEAISQQLGLLQQARASALANPKETMDDAVRLQARAEEQFAQACERLGLEPSADAVGSVVQQGAMGDPVTLFDQPQSRGNWKTFWVSFPDIHDWDNRAMSAVYYPGLLDVPPMATLTSQSFYRGRAMYIGGVPTSGDIELTAQGFARSVVSIFMGLAVPIH